MRIYLFYLIEYFDQILCQFHWISEKLDLLVKLEEKSGDYQSHPTCTMNVCCFMMIHPIVGSDGPTDIAIRS